MENSNNIKGLVCLMIFSSAIVVLIFPVSVGASWRCLGATEYKFVIENHFGEAFMQQHSGDDIEFYCHSASSSPWTLSHPSKDFRRKRMSLFKLVEFGICGGGWKMLRRTIVLLPPKTAGGVLLTSRCFVQRMIVSRPSSFASGTCMTIMHFSTHPPKTPGLVSITFS